MQNVFPGLDPFPRRKRFVRLSVTYTRVANSNFTRSGSESDDIFFVPITSLDRSGYHGHVARAIDGRFPRTKAEN